MRSDSSFTRSASCRHCDRHIPAAAEVAPQVVREPRVVQHHEERLRVVRPLAEHPRPFVDPGHLGRGVAPGGNQRRPEHGQEVQFPPLSRAVVGQPFQQRETAPGQSCRFLIRKEPRRVRRGREEVLGRLVRIPGGLVEIRQFEHRRRRRSLTVGQGIRRGPTELCPPGRPQRSVERVLVKHVDEAIADRERAVVQLTLVDGTDERVDPIEDLEPLLHDRAVHAEYASQGRRIELVALDACGHEQLAVFFAELRHFQLDHAAYRRGQVVLGGLERAGQRPDAVAKGDDPALPQVPHQVGHEERTSLGARVDPIGEGGGHPVARTLECQILADVVCRQEVQHDLPAGAAGLQVELHAQEGMLRDEHLRRAVGGHEQQRHARQAVGEKRQQIDGRGIGPVQILEHQHHRALLCQRLEERPELALHPLGRLCTFGLQALARGIVQDRRHLQEPRRCHPAQRLDHRLAARDAQRLQDLQPGQIRLGAGEALGRAAAAHERRLAARGDPGQEVVDEGALADAGLADQAQEHATARAGFRKPGADLAALALVAHQVARARGHRRHRRASRCPRARQLIQRGRHLHGIRPRPFGPGQHPQDQPVECLGEVAGPPARRLRRPRRDGLQRRQHGRRREGVTACGELVEHDAQRKDVRGRGHAVAAGLLR